MRDGNKAIAILGASGLIGQALAEDLARRGFAVTAIARRFGAAQRNAFAATAVECQFVGFDGDQLARFIGGLNADVIVNCVGLLQDGPNGRAEDVHGGFVVRLVTAVARAERAILLVHLSIPGGPDQDRTAFSRTKRQAEQVLRACGAPFLILRPGFVIAPAAYGGSALIRALAALPLRLPAAARNRPFAATAASDIAATIAQIAARWRKDERDWRVTWDVMERRPSSVGDVIETFRSRFGGPAPRMTLPNWLLDFGAHCADLASRLGWSPPIRSTALAEMRRGVEGDPAPWIAATGIEPASLQSAVAALAATIQERWFARLYLAKALVIGCLAFFWIASGFVALSVGYDTAAQILTRHGLPAGLAGASVGATSILDIAIGSLIGFRRTCQAGLLGGLALSLAYLLGATILAPELWADPLGPLVKIAPITVLMLVALALLDDR